ncbi:VQ motif-containing family protein [Striga asiatica]|uniref:VQ motif-containing family protein n=1 Tax=Striga asiatica TaxID=4170 RepID=A0A5A7QVD3_STRAF|nr:VQ motif-containing family protein [Striga asiatica]
MDLPDISSGRSPRRELQGPRPTPLKVRKDSHKIRKPPIAPPPAAAAPPTDHHAPPRPPVIIYTVSPKIIHANPNEFMSLVQRLTGPNSSACATSPSASTSHAFQESGGAISPAARLASIEKTKSPVFGQSIGGLTNDDDQGLENMGLVDCHNIQRTGNFPGILSPNPNALSPIPPTFFSPPSLDNINNNYNNSSNNPLSFFHDFSPVLHRPSWGFGGEGVGVGLRGAALRLVFGLVGGGSMLAVIRS